MRMRRRLSNRVGAAARRASRRSARVASRPSRLTGMRRNAAAAVVRDEHDTALPID